MRSSLHLHQWREGEDFVLDLGADLAFKPGIFDDYETSGFIVGLHAGLGYVSW